VTYSYDGKAEFLASSLQSPLSPDPSETILLSCWFGAQETFLIIINVVLHNMFVGSVLHPW